MRAVTKRDFLKLSGAAGAFALSGMPAHAAGPKVTVNTYGGLYETAVTENFIASYKAATGGDAEAVIDIPSAALSKIRATMPNPDYDLFIATPNDTIRAIELDLVEEIDPAKLGNLKDIPEVNYSQWKNQAVSFSYGIVGFLYDTRKISNPPKTWAEFADRTISGEFGRSVAIPSASQAGILEICVWPIVDAFGGTVEKPDAGFDKLRQMAPFVAKNFSDMSEVVQLMSTGEISIAIYVDGRAWSFVENNPWANFAVPEKGGIFQSSQIMKVKGTPDEAWKLLDTFLAKEPSEGFVEKILYPVTNSTVVYSPRMQARLTPAENIVYPPYFDIFKHTSALIERWNKEVGG